MKIFVAGGAGFIGSHVAERLVASGHTVAVYDSLISGSESSLPVDKINFFEADIRERVKLINTVAMFNPDIIIHCAVEPVKHPIDPWTDVQTNVAGTCNLIDAAKECGVKRFIYFQTVLIYGAIDSEDPIGINHPVAPTNSYAITKLCAENFIVNSGLDFISFRLANHYGPRNFTGAFPVFYKKLTSSESCTVVNARRSLVFVSDLVDLVIKGCDLSYPGGIYHVSSNEDYSIKELFLLMNFMLNEQGSDQTHIFREPDKDDMKIMKLDWSRTKDTFNWEPQIDISTGLERTVNWYKLNGVTKTYTHLKGV